MEMKKVKVGKKVYINAGPGGYAVSLTRLLARIRKEPKDIIIEVPLTIYQQKKLQTLYNNL